MKPKALNNFVLILRDEAQSEVGGLYIPDGSQEKPHFGTVFSVGSLVSDKDIKPDCKVMFHKGNGFNIEWDGTEYLVLEGERVIAII